jgi:Tol biopolymer transport system component
MVEISASPTARILPTATLTPTLDSLPTINPSLFNTPFPTEGPSPFYSLASPNGEFVANAYFENQLPSGLQTIEVRDKGNKLIWVIPYQGEPPNSDPRPVLNILQWSSDSSQLYFYYVLSPDGGDIAFWWTGFDLQSLNMNTGEVQKILPGKGSMSFAVSPDGATIAYTRSQDNPFVIYIRNLSTDSEKKAAVINSSNNYARVGDIHWSPNGQDVAFQTETEEGKIQTILLNPVTLKQKVVEEYDLYTKWFDGWAENGKLQFSQISDDGMRIDKVFQVDVGSFEENLVGTPTSGP